MAFYPQAVVYSKLETGECKQAAFLRIASKSTQPLEYTKYEDIDGFGLHFAGVKAEKAVGLKFNVDYDHGVYTAGDNHEPDIITSSGLRLEVKCRMGTVYRDFFVPADAEIKWDYGVLVWNITEKELAHRWGDGYGDSAVEIMGYISKESFLKNSRVIQTDENKKDKIRVVHSRFICPLDELRALDINRNLNAAY